MNYQEAIKFLFDSLPMFQRTGRAAYKANLDNTLRLDACFHSPHRHFKTIHIAGTNGKGSVSHMLASVLREAGFRTGLYTSPHLKDFRERIRINGSMIPMEEVTRFVENHQGILEEIEPSFFEMTVALAFNFFAEQKVDVAVIETGLGGRLDSTNIITPELSVITNISMDHMEFLGNDIPSIAREKAGIIKPGVPVIIGSAEEQSGQVFRKKAAECHSEIIFAPDRFRAGFSTLTIHNRRIFRMTDQRSGGSIEIKTDLLGDYQQENIITVLTATDLLVRENWNIPEEAVKEGLQNVTSGTGLRGRWQIIGQDPRIVCDTGHNEAGITAVVRQILDTPWKRLHMVIGFVNDKDIEKILQILPVNAEYYFTRSSVPRALDQDVLRRKALGYGLKGEAFETVGKAFRAARAAAGPEDMIFVGGSTFVVADLPMIG